MLFNRFRKKKKIEEKVDWSATMEHNNENIDRLARLRTQVNIDPVMEEVIDETEKADKAVGDTFKKLAKDAEGITPKDPDTGKKITIKPYTEKLTLDESLFDETYLPGFGEIPPRGNKYRIEDGAIVVDQDDDFEPYDEDEPLEEKKSSKKSSKHLCEAYNDGWDEEKLSELVYVLDKLNNLNYEIQSCVRGAYSHCSDYESLGNYVSELADSLGMLGEEISEYRDENDEEEVEVEESLEEKKSFDDEEVEEDEYTVADLLNDRLFGYGFNKSNFRGKWKFAEVEPSIKTKDGKTKRSYFYPTAHSDELVTGKDVDRRAFTNDGIGVFVYDESEADLSKKCAEELNLDFEIKKLVKPIKGFSYMAVIKLPDEIAEMAVEDYVESIGKSMKDFLRSKEDKGRADFTGHKNYEFRKNKEQ